MSPFLRQWQAQGADCQSGEWCWIGKLVSAASAGRWSAYWLSQTEKGELSKRSLTSDKGATNCICRLFLQRGFTPKKRRDLSIVRHALFRVQSRRKYEGPFSKPWSQPWGYSNEVLFLRVVCTLLSVWRSLNPKVSSYAPLLTQKKGICVVKITRVAHWTQHHCSWTTYSEVLRMPFQAALSEPYHKSVCTLADKETPIHTCVFLCHLKECLHRIPQKWLQKMQHMKNNFWWPWIVPALLL